VLVVKRANGLRRLRERKLFTQADLAKALGARQASISAWETGGERPSVASMRKLCAVLGVTPDELLAALAEKVGE
jgi:transcriptional regulator with XRE-family HTH domain